MPHPLNEKPAPKMYLVIVTIEGEAEDLAHEIRHTLTTQLSKFEGVENVTADIRNFQSPPRK